MTSCTWAQRMLDQLSVLRVISRGVALYLPNGKETLLLGDAINRHGAVRTINNSAVNGPESENIGCCQILYDMLDDRGSQLNSCFLTVRMRGIDHVDGERMVEVRVSSLSTKEKGGTGDEDDTGKTDDAAKCLAQSEGLAENEIAEKTGGERTQEGDHRCIGER